jgi:hypothetical protein
MTSYVEQEDALIGSMTVRETLKFAADLSLPRYACVFGMLAACTDKWKLCVEATTDGTDSDSPRGIWNPEAGRLAYWDSDSEGDQWRSEAACQRGKPVDHLSQDFVFG